MNLSNWNPFKFNRKKSEDEKLQIQRAGTPQSASSPYAAMQQMMQQLFREPFFGASGGFGALLPDSRWFGDFSPSAFQPTVDVTDEGKALRVTAELPGMAEKDIELSVDEGTLIIKGEKRSDTSAEEGGCYRTERAYGYFNRIVPLPHNIALSGIEATFDKGVLTVRVPKAETQASTSRRIDIKGK